MTGRFSCFIMSTALSQIGRSKVTIAISSPERGKDGPIVVRITFDDWEKVHLCGQLSIICMDPLHPAIPVGVLEVMILAF